tara:strand:- start:440 stop:994 length:555 start_codon:yes stop_codon:yes gene_type:complete
MKQILLLISFFILLSCSKPKTVLICGDHICINKDEAKQYFEENLSLEVKIIDNNVKKEINLIELNLKENINGKRKVSVSTKDNTKKDIKILSDQEVDKIKQDIENKKKNKKIVLKEIKKNDQSIIKEKKLNQKNVKAKIINVDKNQGDIVDVCTILKKCSIDEISKYLLEIGKKKEFPDITTRQ